MTYQSRRVPCCRPLLSLPLVLCVVWLPFAAASSGGDLASSKSAQLEAQPAPWSGIVGFLSMIGRMQERQPDPEFSEEYDDGKPLRKIVYAVEEQVSGDESQNGSVIVFDSERGGRSADSPAANAGRQDAIAITRAKRSASEQSARRTTATVAQPYLLGRKLWYVPLWFGVYLTLYISALVVKSVARHKIKYPTLLSEDDVLNKRRNGIAKSDRVSNAISNGEKRYQRYWSK